VAAQPSRASHAGSTRIVPWLSPCLAALACVEGGNLAISAGAPVTAAVRGVITDCGTPVSGAEVVLRVQQDAPGQTRPVDAEVGPVTTGRNGSYVIEIGPAFAVPGPARVQLRLVGAGTELELIESSLEFSLGIPPRDTVRIDADLGNRCPVR
jgi:hypothetical protein